MRLAPIPLVLPMIGRRDQRTAAKTRDPSFGIHASAARSQSKTMTIPPSAAIS